MKKDDFKVIRDRVIILDADSKYFAAFAYPLIDSNIPTDIRLYISGNMDSGLELFPTYIVSQIRYLRRGKSMIEVAGVYIFGADVPQRTNEANEKVPQNEGVRHALTVILETEKRMNLWVNEKYGSEKKREYFIL
ncbi:unnamed protein product, partial [Onchocerca flexuosa]|uniref:NurA domain-containing protein n=1 Tax=Onchocerca flexuosa TaxID=387005 RepID=A0A183I7T3_9BILA